jgi:hypothetical protein
MQHIESPQPRFFIAALFDSTTCLCYTGNIIRRDRVFHSDFGRAVNCIIVLETKEFCHGLYLTTSQLFILNICGVQIINIVVKMNFLGPCHMALLQTGNSITDDLKSSDSIYTPTQPTVIREISNHL